MTIAVCKGPLDAGLESEEEIQKRQLVQSPEKMGRRFAAGFGCI